MNIRLKPAAFSKINWAQVVGALAMLLSVFGLDLTPEQQAASVLIIGLMVQGITIIVRTFSTTAITTEAADRAGLL